MSKVHNLAGQRFGKLVAVRTTGERRRGQIVWECQCDCGVTKGIASYYLTSGGVISCGCHGKSILGKITTTHGKSSTPEYTVWARMKQRCYDPKCERYPHYGGRGIVVCDRWINSFENFLSDMGSKPTSKHSINRKNNDGNYEPGNCEWADAVTQMNNTSANVHLTLNGVTKTKMQWATHTGLNEGTIRGRLKHGWALEQSLSTPAKIKENLSGLSFGRWTVVNESTVKQGWSSMWNCVCKCGTEQAVRGAHLKNGATKSCGCARGEL